MITPPSIALRLLLIWSSWLVLPAFVGRVAAQQANLPLWKQGVSRFNGTGYDVRASSDAPAQLDLTPYTVPSAPSATNGLTLDRPKSGATTPVSTDSLALPKSSPALPTSGDFVAPAPTPLRNPDSASSDSGHPAAATTGSAQSNGDVKPPDSSGDSPADSPTNKTRSDAIAADSLPLQQDVVRWYQYPIRWMRGWDSNAEFGIDGSDGNANTLALQTGVELNRKTQRSTWEIDLDYRQASSNNVTTENNGRFNFDYDRLIAESDWAAFGKFGLEWDKFKAFDLRLNMNAGLGYHWVRTEDATFVTRFGAGASREMGAPIDEWTPEGVFGIEAERQLTRRQKLKGKLDYFPAWEDFGDYRVVSDVSWEVLLDGSENLSLKLAATDRYDSTPQGARPNDLYYSLLLLYKF